LLAIHYIGLTVNFRRKIMRSLVNTALFICFFVAPPSLLHGQVQQEVVWHGSGFSKFGSVNPPAATQLRKLSEMFGPIEPAHYAFASFKPVGQFRGKEVVGSRMTQFDPTTPIGSWKKAWRKLTKEAGLSGLRFHDLRHHAITQLPTNPNIASNHKVDCRPRFTADDRPLRSHQT
jgi:hypothetical protein